jgi:BlaI family penicillinase repressor
MANRPTQPSDFELQILGVLWEHGPLTVRQVMSYLTDKKRAYTSVLSVIQVMQKKGLVAAQAERQGLANVYESKVARSAVVKPLLKGLVSRAFGGRTSDIVQHLLQDGEVNQMEIEELRALLDESEKRLK